MFLINTASIREIREFVRAELSLAETEVSSEATWKDPAVTSEKIAAVFLKLGWIENYSWLWHPLCAIRSFFQKRAIRHILTDELRLFQEKALDLLDKACDQAIQNIFQSKASKDSLQKNADCFVPRITHYFTPSVIHGHIAARWQDALKLAGSPLDAIRFICSFDKTNDTQKHQAAVLLTLYPALEKYIDSSLKEELLAIYQTTDDALFRSFYAGTSGLQEKIWATWDLTASQRADLPNAKEIEREQLAKDFITRPPWAAVQVTHLKARQVTTLVSTPRGQRETQLETSVLGPLSLSERASTPQDDFTTLLYKFLHQGAGGSAFYLWWNGLQGWLPIEYTNLWKLSLQNENVEIFATVQSETFLHFQYVIKYDVVPFSAASGLGQAPYEGPKIPVGCEYEATISYNSEGQRWSGSVPTLCSATFGNSKFIQS